VTRTKTEAAKVLLAVGWSIEDVCWVLEVEPSFAFPAPVAPEETIKPLWHGPVAPLTTGPVAPLTVGPSQPRTHEWSYKPPTTGSGQIIPHDATGPLDRSPLPEQPGVLFDASIAEILIGLGAEAPEAHES
jgi:hypothetical protein